MNTVLSKLSEYVWVEEVRGPLKFRRNRVVRVDEPPRPTDEELYRSVYVCDERLREFFDRNKGNGNPSGIRGFDGPRTVLDIPFDFDREINVKGRRVPDFERAFQDARQFLEALRVLYEVDLQIVRCALTGGRGVHVHLPAELFGGIAPSELAPELVKAIALTLGQEIGIQIDGTIYDPSRLLRVPNSRHTSGLYCVPVYTSELLHGRTSELKEKMETLRPEVSWVGEVGEVSGLAAIKQDCEREIERKRQKATAFPTAPEGRREEIRVLLKGRGIEFTVQGHDYLMRCPSPGHEDEDPSFRIHMDTGVYHCFGCDIRGSWEEGKALFSEGSPRRSGFAGRSPTTLIDVKSTFRRWLHLEDDSFIDIGLAAVIANNFPGDPVWLFLVGPPGSCKTEFLRSLTSPKVYTLSSLTPNSLISGLKTPRGTDPSLLPKLDGKVLVIKDFTSILSARQEARAEIFGQLRDVYDGYCEKSFGSGVGVRRHRCHVGILAAVTPEIDRFHSIEQVLGERFLKLRISFSDPDEAVSRAMENFGQQLKMRADLNEVVQQFLDRPWPDSPNVVTISDEYSARIGKLASLIALLRTAVPKNRQGELEYVPMAEVGTRLAVQFKKLGAALCLVRGKPSFGEDEYQLLRRVGVDSLPSLRWEFVRRMVELEEDGMPWHSTQDIGEAAKVSTDSANATLHDLFALEIVDREGSGRFDWRLAERVVRLLRGTGLMQDELPLSRGANSGG